MIVFLCCDDDHAVSVLGLEVIEKSKKRTWLTIKSVLISITASTCYFILYVINHLHIDIST